MFMFVIEKYCRWLLGIVQFIFICQIVSFHQVRVNAMRLDGVNQVQDWKTCADGFVLNRGTNAAN